VTWYYPGQEVAEIMLRSDSVLNTKGHGGAEVGGEGEAGGEGGAHELAARMLIRAVANAAA
jgi:hypothetical protein